MMLSASKVTTIPDSVMWSPAGAGFNSPSTSTNTLSPSAKADPLSFEILVPSSSVAVANFSFVVSFTSVKLKCCFTRLFKSSLVII